MNWRKPRMQSTSRHIRSKTPSPEFARPDLEYTRALESRMVAIEISPSEALRTRSVFLAPSGKFYANGRDHNGIASTVDLNGTDLNTAGFVRIFSFAPTMAIRIATKPTSAQIDALEDMAARTSYNILLDMYHSGNLTPWQQIDSVSDVRRLIDQ